jgi:serine/threonine-protein kinase
VDVPDPTKARRVIDGKYQLVRQLAEGGMGAVYEGLHLGTQRRVAIKLISTERLSSDPDIVARFKREAMATGAIESQHIAHVLDVGTDPTSDNPYMVMELLVGEDVEQLLSELGTLPASLALRIGLQAAIGLQKAHEHGVIHRDVKPANIYLARRDGGERVVKLVDFGIAKVKKDPLSTSRGKAETRPGTMLGSPLYMSPEQAYGKKTLDHRTDIWSLGVVLYEMLAGEPPHNHTETIGELIIHVCQIPARPIRELAPWLPLNVAEVVHKALELDMRDRFATAEEMLNALRALLPEGSRIDEEMLVGVNGKHRAVLSPRLELVDEARSASSARALVVPEGRGVAPSAVTTVSGAQTDTHPEVPMRGSRTGFVVGLAATLACVVGVAVAFGGSHTTPAAATVAPRPAPSVAAPSAAPSSRPPVNDVPWRVAEAASSAPIPPPAAAATPKPVLVSHPRVAPATAVVSAPPPTVAKPVSPPATHSPAPAPAPTLDPASIR